MNIFGNKGRMTRTKKMVIIKTKKDKKDTLLLIFNNFVKKGKIEKKGKKNSCRKKKSR